MNEGNVAIVVVVLVAVCAAVVSGGGLDDEPAPLVEDLGADRAETVCHLGASVNPDRLDVGERLVFDYEIRTQSFSTRDGATRLGATTRPGANVTVYRVDTTGAGSVDVLERGRLTSDCRLVGRADP